MAVLVPDIPAGGTASERQVYGRLGRDLDRDWIVLHSLGLARHGTKLWGEADFVVLSTKGIFALEVKGGEVSCRDGVWRYGWPGSADCYEKRESPFSQAKDAMFAVKKIVEAESGLEDLLIGYGVVMPHVRFTATGPEIEPEVLLDARAYSRHLGFYLGRLSRHWQDVYRERHGRERRLPTLADVRRVRQLLRPDVDATVSLGSWFNGLEQQLIQLTGQQIRAARGMANNPRTVVTGRAGTGKTVVALDRTEKLAAEGRKVLYVCFNQMLARHVELGVRSRPGAENIRVRHLHGLYRETIGKAGLAGRLDSEEVAGEELYGRVYPEVFVEAALAVEPEPADVLVVDEAQDLLTPANLDALDLLVRDGLRRGRWHLFLDPLQNIYGKDADDAMAVLEDAGFASYELRDNCRNTRQVAIQTSIVSGLDLAIDGAVDGPPCDCVFYRDAADFLGRLEAEVRRLLEADVAPGSMIVLSTRRRENSLLSSVASLAGLPLNDLAAGERSGAIDFATMHGFKGLERRVVLAVDLDRLGDEALAMLHYAGLSRAIVLLRPFVAESDRPAYERQARAFGARIGASGAG